MDLDYTKLKKGISRQQAHRLSNACAIAKKLTLEEAKTMLDDINKAVGTTIINKYIAHNNSNNIIGGVHCTTFSQQSRQEQPQLLREPLESEQEVDGEEELEQDDESEQDNYVFNSDITIEYHGQRTANYHFANLPMNKRPSNEGAWMIMDQCVSGRCYDIKASSLLLHHKAANMGDLRLLALNDIYLIGNDLDNSITKYFDGTLRRTVLASIDFNMDMPPAPEQSSIWCFGVAQNPPTDFVSAISFPTKCLSATIGSGNQVDLHVAHALTQYLPLFFALPPPCNIEDSYIHHYLAPIFQSVFASNSLFKVDWANSQMVNDNYKPDLLVSARCGSFPLAILVGEFKAPLYNSSQTESDLVKLGNEMRSMINDLVIKGTPDPAVCGVLVQGFDMSTFVMDLSSPKLYRLTKLANLTIFKTLDQICNLPLITSRLVQLTTIASNTISKAENAILSDRRQATYQLGWISQEKCSLMKNSPNKRQSQT